MHKNTVSNQLYRGVMKRILLPGTGNPFIVMTMLCIQHSCGTKVTVLSPSHRSVTSTSGRVTSPRMSTATLPWPAIDRSTSHHKHAQTQARFPFIRNRLHCVRCVNENRKKRKRLRLNGNRASRLSSVSPVDYPRAGSGSNSRNLLVPPLSGGIVTPYFRIQVKNLLSTAVNRCDLWRLNYTKTVF